MLGEPVPVRVEDVRARCSTRMQTTVLEPASPRSELRDEVVSFRQIFNSQMVRNSNEGMLCPKVKLVGEGVAGTPGCLSKTPMDRNKTLSGVFSADQGTIVYLQ